MRKIISIILCFVMILSLAACGDSSDTATKKKKKKIIVVKNKDDTSQADDAENSSDKANNENAGFDFDWGDEYPDTDDSDGSDEKKSPYEVELEAVEVSPANARIGMSLYHYSIGKWNNSLGNVYGDESSFLNYYRMSSIEEAQQIKKSGGMGWLHILNPFADRQTLEFNTGWKEGITANVKAFKALGLWSCIAGFETEEICLAITSEQFKILTKYLKETYPEKRIFSCLSYYEVKGAAPSGFNVAPMSYDSYGYITDIGFDWYGTVSYDEQKKLVEEMKANIGRTNVRIWFFPTTHMYTAETTVEFMIEHLNMCYKLLMEQENPGGLYLYTWESYGNNTGLRDLIDPSLNKGNERLADRITEIGREILNNPYRYEESKN